MPKKDYDDEEINNLKKDPFDDEDDRDDDEDDRGDDEDDEYEDDGDIQTSYSKEDEEDE